MMRAKIFANRRGSKEEMWLWFAHGCTGMLVGVVAFCMAFCEDTLTEWKAENVQHLIDTHNDNTSAAYGFFFSFCIALVVIANLMTLYVGPGANGSGVAEVMGLLNGINYPQVIGFRTLITKIIGTTLAVSGGLCIGKEGPLLHIGAIVGCITCWMPIKGLRCLQNDVSKRQMISAGGAAGVAAAFGAPIGGALFTYEISKPNTFWTFSMLWRVFFGTAIAVFTLSVLTSLHNKTPLGLSDTAILKFGTLETTTSSMLDLPAAVCIGLVCGLLGTSFIWVNTNLGIYRKKYINTNAKKIFEAIFFAFTTSSCFFLGVLCTKNDCIKITDTA